jgi:hypothetical protein
LSSRNRPQTSKGPLLWPLLMVVIGGFLLLSNFFLLGEVNILDLWPLILVLLGTWLLLRGDIIPNSDFRTFGITRGSIESATLEVNSGEIDVQMRGLQSRNAERLIAGQYAHGARPELETTDVHAHLKLERQHTPWLSFADWEAGLSLDLPWQIVISSYLGQVTADLSHVIMQNALISTGMGDIHLTPPAEAFESLYLRSILGNITITTPPQYNTRITVEGGRFFGVHVDESRYQSMGEGVYTARDADSDLPLVDIVITGTFGDAYLT